MQLLLVASHKEKLTRYFAAAGEPLFSEEKLFDSFEMRDEHGKLTNTGALLADDAPIKHSRLFCTRWNGLDKSGGMVDALDSAEYSGSLIILLNEGVGFVKRNMKTRWKKTANSRIEMPDYCERSVEVCQNQPYANLIYLCMTMTKTLPNGILRKMEITNLLSIELLKTEPTILYSGDVKFGIILKMDVPRKLNAHVISQKL